MNKLENHTIILPRTKEKTNNFSLLECPFLSDAKNTNVYPLMKLNRHPSSWLFVLMDHFLTNEDNEVFHYLSFVDLYQIQWISNQNQSMKVMTMKPDECTPNHTFDRSTYLLFILPYCIIHCME